MQLIQQWIFFPQAYMEAWKKLSSEVLYLAKSGGFFRVISQVSVGRPAVHAVHLLHRSVATTVFCYINVWWYANTSFGGKPWITCWSPLSSRGSMRRKDEIIMGQNLHSGVHSVWMSVIVIYNKYKTSFTKTAVTWKRRDCLNNCVNETNDFVNASITWYIVKVCSYCYLLLFFILLAVNFYFTINILPVKNANDPVEKNKIQGEAHGIFQNR